MRPPDTPAPGAQAVLRYVLAHEGAHFREIQRSLRIGTGQADHHLRRLQRAGWLVPARLGGEVHFFPASRDRQELRPLAALRHPARRAAVRALLDGPLPLRALAERTGIPETTLLHHLRTLLCAGVVYRAEERRRVRYGVSDPAWAAAAGLPEALGERPRKRLAPSAHPRPPRV